MPDLSRAVPLGDGIPILGQPTEPPESNGPAIITDVEVAPMVLTISGERHPGLSIRFEMPPLGWMPPLVVAIPYEGLLAFPDVVRKAVREAKRAADTVDTTSTEDEA